ncbi:hypothetical protein MLPF_1268 [Mycobacterium lepromatosis]|nr:hypothetical protein MLPF_1268 [Mycobacterium lepromatosis]
MKLATWLISVGYPYLDSRNTQLQNDNGALLSDNTELLVPRRPVSMILR